MAGIEFWTWEIICFSFIFLAGVLGNLTVILVVLKSGSARHRLREVPFNIYLMALAIVDLTFAITCLPIYILSTNVFNHPSGTKGDVLCKIITGYFIPFWLCDVSIYMLVIISFERYAAICKPFQAVHLGIPRKTYFYIAAAYLAALIIQIPTIVGIRYAGVNGTVNFCTYVWPSETVSTIIYAVVFICHFVIPAAIFIINFYRIKRCLTKLDENLRRSIGDAKGRIKIMKSKEKTIRIVFVVMVAFFVLWTPNHVMYFLFQFGEIHNLRWNSNYYQVGIILGFSSSWLNPFLYAFQSRDFRSHCRKVFRKMFGKWFVGQLKDSSQSGNTSSTLKTNIKFKRLQVQMDNTAGNAQQN
ncbi:phe13-bombesin receptor-like [Dendronephthya gigantea]|uniref:phe13-bombesin receptor-like n=1 Tax=Dendronephthya gigantea TaxID=151771 RepID=UPI001069D83A|nr:phe13-bombesin receptor-like [Dendronephthya gigantea]